LKKQYASQITTPGKTDGKKDIKRYKKKTDTQKSDTKKPDTKKGKGKI